MGFRKLSDIILSDPSVHQGLYHNKQQKIDKGISNYRMSEGIQFDSEISHKIIGDGACIIRSRKI